MARTILYVLFLLLLVGVFYDPTDISAQNAQSASLFFGASSTQIETGERLTVDVKINAIDQSINAISGVIAYPSDLVRVVSVSKEKSIFNLWIKEPKVSGDSILFEGVVLNPGFKGADGFVLRVILETVKKGTAVLNFSKGVVLANDGRGTNVPTTLSSATLNIITPPLLPAYFEKNSTGNNSIAKSVAVPFVTKYFNFIESKKMLFLEGRGEVITPIKIIFLDIIAFFFLWYFWKKMQAIRHKKPLEISLK